MATITVYDDPMNPHGWVLEPVRRKLRARFPEIDWDVRPVVLVPSWDEYEGPELRNGRTGMASTCARLSERSGMPIDEYLWFENPPSSSRDACRALAAVDSTDQTASLRLLRALREATFIRRRDVSDRDRLRDLVADVPDLDVDSVFDRMENGTADARLDRYRIPDRDVPGTRRTNGRYELPTLVAEGENGTAGVSGRTTFDAAGEAIRTATGQDPEPGPDDVRTAIERFSPEGWISIAELSALVETTERGVIEAAADLPEEVVERTFASESFWRLAEHVPTDD